MPNDAVQEIFEKMSPKDYDTTNQRLRAISDNLHFLSRIVLKDLPANARVLCVGVGTGAEILALGAAYPQWQFTGLDPSANMLSGCRERLAEQGLDQRCELIQGYLADLEPERKFDAVLSFLVMHFVQDKAERSGMYQKMHAHLNTGGILLNAEISGAAAAPSFAALMEDWKALQILAGTPPEKAEQIPEMYKSHLAVLPPAETEAMMQTAGFLLPVCFFQSLLIRAWYAYKT